MRLTPLTALLLIACGTSAPSKPSASTELGSAAEAIRQLGKNDADVVQRCERIVDRCEAAAADSGAGSGVCGGIAAWLGWKPDRVRIAYVIASVLSAAFPGIIVYLLLWLVMPDADEA